jgi:hypothetical protein
MKFEYTSPDGEVTIKEINSGTWLQNLDSFVLFLRGCGYAITNESILYNASQHSLIDDGEIMNIQPYYED